MSRPLTASSQGRKTSLTVDKPRWGSSNRISSALPALQSERRRALLTTLPSSYGSPDETWNRRKQSIQPRRRVKSAPLSRCDNTVVRSPVYNDPLKRRVYPGVPPRPVVGGWLDGGDESESDGGSSDDDEWEEIMAEFDPDSYWSRKLRNVLIIRQIPIHLVNKAEKLDWLRKQFTAMMGNRANRKARPTTAQFERVLERYERKQPAARVGGNFGNDRLQGTTKRSDGGDGKDDDEDDVVGGTGTGRRQSRRGRRNTAESELAAVDEDDEIDSTTMSGNGYGSSVQRRTKSLVSGGDDCEKCTENGDSGWANKGENRSNDDDDDDKNVNGANSSGVGRGRDKLESDDGKMDAGGGGGALADVKRNDYLGASGNRSSLSSNSRLKSRGGTHGDGADSVNILTGAQGEKSQSGGSRAGENSFATAENELTSTTRTKDRGNTGGKGGTEMEGIGSNSLEDGAGTSAKPKGIMKPFGRLPPLQRSKGDRSGKLLGDGGDNDVLTESRKDNRTAEKSSTSIAAGPAPHVRFNIEKKAEDDEEDDDDDANDPFPTRGIGRGGEQRGPASNDSLLPLTRRRASTLPELYSLGLGTTSSYLSYFPLLAQAKDDNARKKLKPRQEQKKK
ncbi:protein qua-1-like [Oscarella lobularis]|uniref:protein qua-1-like n=1 Tax=Oscarella lobularis TaxID=121494 RepID=UPI003313E3F7